VVWMEDNICIYRYGEILHTSAVLVGTIHVTGIWNDIVSKVKGFCDQLTQRINGLGFDFMVLYHKS
jgi:hypothetical protein